MCPLDRVLTYENSMAYRSSETVHRLGYFQSSVSVQIMFK